MINKIFSSLILFLGIWMLQGCMDTAPRFSNLQFSEPGPVEELVNGFKPIFNPGGKSILYTDAKDQGLFEYDLETKQSKQITKERLLGFEVFFEETGQFFCFAEHDFSGKRRLSRLMLVGFENEPVKTIVKDIRHLRILGFSADKITFLDGDNAFEYDIVKDTINKTTTVTAVLLDRDLNLVFYQDGKPRVMNPQGKENYLWPSLSPDAKSILYSVSGKGSYISDLQGEQVVSLGRLHAPSWSPDGKWVVGMDDYDDGERFIKSDIVIVSADGTHRMNLTEKFSKIALYPSFSPNGKEVIFNDENGIIYRMKTK